MKLIDLNSVPNQKIEGRKDLFHRIIVGPETGGRQFEFIISSMGPEGHGPLHSHPHSEHILVVTKGKLKLSNKEEEHIVNEQQGILLEPGEEHEVFNINGSITEYFVVYAPPPR